MPESHSVDLSSARVFGRLVRSWNRRDRVEVALLAAVIALLHLFGFGALVMIVAPHHYQVGAGVWDRAWETTVRDPAE